MSRSAERGLFTRRSFLRWSQSAMALLGAAPIVGAGAASEAFALPAAANSADDYYAKLGVEKIINAAGTYTYLTAALMPPQVQRAVAQAALHPVRLKDLQQASGEYIAKKLRCEGAVVSSGASAALTLATAACIASANGTKPDQIPENVDHMKHEVDVLRRSEEHTSELQSLRHLVCRLLLEKKKQDRPRPRDGPADAAARSSLSDRP